MLAASDLKKYLKKLTETGQRGTFRYIVCKKLGIEINTYYKWVARGFVPNRDNLHEKILDIINDTTYFLPEYENK